jgi:hypothetical protein
VSAARGGVWWREGVVGGEGASNGANGGERGEWGERGVNGGHREQGGAVMTQGAWGTRGAVRRLVYRRAGIEEGSGGSQGAERGEWGAQGPNAGNGARRGRTQGNGGAQEVGGDPGQLVAAGVDVGDVAGAAVGSGGQTGCCGWQGTGGDGRGDVCDVARPLEGNGGRAASSVTWTVARLVWGSRGGVGDGGGELRAVGLSERRTRGRSVCLGAGAVTGSGRGPSW